jgi:hypothetical protein
MNWVSAWPTTCTCSTERSRITDSTSEWADSAFIFHSDSCMPSARMSALRCSFLQRRAGRFCSCTPISR